MVPSGPFAMAKHGLAQERDVSPSQKSFLQCQNTYVRFKILEIQFGFGYVNNDASDIA